MLLKRLRNGDGSSVPWPGVSHLCRELCGPTIACAAIRSSRPCEKGVTRQSPEAHVQRHCGCPSNKSCATLIQIKNCFPAMGQVSHNNGSPSVVARRRWGPSNPVSNADLMSELLMPELLIPEFNRRGALVRYRGAACSLDWMRHTPRCHSSASYGGFPAQARCHAIKPCLSAERINYGQSA